MLQAALIAAPLVLQGISTIGSIFGSRKAKKQMKAQLEAMNAQTAAGARALQAQTQAVLGSIGGNYTGPSGITAGAQGIGRMAGGPPFLGA